MGSGAARHEVRTRLRRQPRPAAIRRRATTHIHHLRLERIRRGRHRRLRSEWEAELRDMKSGLASGANLGLPLSVGGRQRIFTIYAWNEFGEGGIVASDLNGKRSCAT